MLSNDQKVIDAVIMRLQEMFDPMMQDRLDWAKVAQNIVQAIDEVETRPLLYVTLDEHSVARGIAAAKDELAKTSETAAVNAFTLVASIYDAMDSEQHEDDGAFTVTPLTPEQWDEQFAQLLLLMKWRGRERPEPVTP
jgi:hypothetical protein